MYNTKINCTYHIIDCDDTYRTEFLEIFELDCLDEEELNKKFTYLFTKIQECKDKDTKIELINCMKKAALLFLTEDLLTGFIVLYSFDYFNFLHECMCELLETDKVSCEKINLLKQALDL